MNLELASSMFIVFFGLIGILLGIWIIARSEGRFRAAMILLFLAVLAYTLKGLVGICYFLGISKFGGIYDGIQLATAVFVILLITCAMYEFKIMVEKLKEKYNHRKKGKKLF